MNTRHYYFPIGCCLVLLSGCTTTPDGGDLDRAWFSRDGETTFVTSPTSGELKIRDLAAIAKVIRKYRDLTAAEKALVKLAVRRHFDGIVALEVKKLKAEPAQVAERQRIQRMPDPQARKQAKLKYEEQILKEAARRAGLRLGQALALPVKTSRNQSVAVFARFVHDDIMVSDAAYETDKSLADLGNTSKLNFPDAPEDGALAEISTGSKSGLVIADSSVVIK